MSKAFKNPNFLDLNLHNQFDSFSSTVSRWNDVVLDVLTTPNTLTDINAICISGLRTGQTNGSSTYQNDARFEELNGENYLVIKVKRTGVEAKCRPDFQSDAKNNIQSEFILGMYEEAYSDVPVPNGIGAISPGSTLKCFFADGRDIGLPERQLFFRADSVGGNFSNFIAKAFDVPESISNLFNNIQELPNQVASGVCPSTPEEKTKLEALAKRVGLDLPVLLAVRAVESGGKASALRFEPHLFRRKRPDLKQYIPYSPKNSKNPVDYNRSNTNRAAFERAFALDPVVAIASTSFGLYQVMGYNSENTGNPLLNKGQTDQAGAEAFVKEFFANPVNTSDELLVAWFSKNPNALAAAKEKNWRRFATVYNGSLCCGPNTHQYDVKLAQYYQAALKC